MSEWEEQLPPIMREKLAKIGELTPEEKERMKEKEWLESILSKYYKGDLDSKGLWERLKGSKQSLLSMAQLRIMESLG